MPIFGRWKAKRGIWWRAWQGFKRFSPYGSQIEELGRATGIGQGRRQAKQ